MPRDVRRWTQTLAPTLPYLSAILAVRSIRAGARRAGEDTVRRSRRSSAAAGRPDPPGEEAARLAARPAVYSVGPVERAPSVGAWRSLVARIVRDDEVGGSNPLAPTSPITPCVSNRCSRAPITPSSHAFSFGWGYAATISGPSTSSRP